MKKAFFIIFLFLFSLNCSVYSQNRDNHRFNPDRFQADLEKYIVKKAALTPKESAAFLPVYREMKTKMRQVFDSNFKKINANSDAECKKFIQQRDANELQLKKIQQQYHNKFLKILPPTKLYKLIREEENFHRYAFNKALENRKNKDDQKRRNDNRKSKDPRNRN